MNQRFTKVGVKAAYETARSLYSTRDEAIQAVSDQLCMPTEAVEDALLPETLHE